MSGRYSYGRLTAICKQRHYVSNVLLGLIFTALESSTLQKLKPELCSQPVAWFVRCVLVWETQMSQLIIHWHLLHFEYVFITYEEKQGSLSHIFQR